MNRSSDIDMSAAGLRKLAIQFIMLNEKDQRELIALSYRGSPIWRGKYLRFEGAVMVAITSSAQSSVITAESMETTSRVSFVSAAILSRTLAGTLKTTSPPSVESSPPRSAGFALQR
ncbi:MAG: hypothetical protein R3F31_20085 [Verrucomicrobiales bacterium]